MLLSLNFSNLSTEGYAAFILALIFTIFTFSGGLFILRHKDSSKVSTAVIVFGLPFLTIFCWAYLICSIYELKLGFCLLASILSSVAYLVVAYSIGFCISNHKKKVEARAAQQANETKKSEPANNSKQKN